MVNKHELVDNASSRGPESAHGRFSLRWLSHMGMRLLSAIANSSERGAVGPYRPESPGGGPEQPPGPSFMACCSLALPNKECAYIGDKSNYVCPDGWYRQWWFCCEGTNQAGCGECTRDTSSCWRGPFECSIWWYTGRSC